MKIKNNDLLFLLYYIPLFFVKLLTFDRSTNILKVVAICSFTVFVLRLIAEKTYSKKEMLVWLSAGLFLSLLVITCGKEGALFSLIAIICMRKTNINKNMSILFYIGIIGVALCMYMTRDTRYTIRYVGGAWVSMIKRSNIAFISFFAVINIYLITYRKLNCKKIIVISLLSYAIYKYTGCRSGIICVMILLIMLIGYRWSWFRKSRMIKSLVIMMPFICFVISVYLVYLYDHGNRIAVLINNSLQGRLRQGSLFFTRYTPRLFGQKLAENFSTNNYFVLDSTYLDMFLCYGILFTAMWIILSCAVLKWLYKKGNYIGIAILVSYSVFGITETFLPNCFLNPSLLLYGKYILEKLDISDDKSAPIQLFGISRLRYCMKS